MRKHRGFFKRISSLVLAAALVLVNTPIPDAASFAYAAEETAEVQENSGNESSSVGVESSTGSGTVSEAGSGTEAGSSEVSASGSENAGGGSESAGESSGSAAESGSSVSGGSESSGSEVGGSESGSSESSGAVSGSESDQSGSDESGSAGTGSEVSGSGESSQAGTGTTETGSTETGSGDTGASSGNTENTEAGSGSESGQGAGTGTTDIGAGTGTVSGESGSGETGSGETVIVIDTTEDGTGSDEDVKESVVEIISTEEGGSTAGTGGSGSGASAGTAAGQTAIETEAKEAADLAAAEKEAAEKEKAEKEQPEKEKEEEAAGFSATRELDGVLITVTAPEGVFPSGSVLSVSKVRSSKQIEKIDDSIREVKENEDTGSREALVSDKYVFDIKVLKDGREVQPDTEYGDVSVSFTMKKSFKEEDTIDVYHVSKAEDQTKEETNSDLTVYEDETEEEQTEALSENNEETAAAAEEAETAAAAAETTADAAESALTAEKMENVSVEQGVIPEAAAETEFGKKAAAEIEKKEENGETADITTISVMTGSFSYFVLEITTLEKILTASDGNTYKVTVSFTEEAEIPVNAELQVTEIPEEDAAEYREWAADALNWTENDHIFYTRFFDITILSGDEEVEPAAPVSVTVELLDGRLDENPELDGAELAEMLQVVHFDESGDGMSAQELEARSYTGEDGYDVSFETDGFSVFGVGGIAKTLLNWTTDELDVTVKGLSSRMEPGYEQKEEITGLEEGLELLDAYEISGSTGDSAMLWAHIRETSEPELGTLESINIYGTSGGELGPSVVEQLKTGEEIMIPIDSMTDGFAFVKDTGLRHQEIEMSPAEGQIVRLDGMMPKEASAEIIDVTGEFAGHTFGATETEKQSEDYCYRDSAKAGETLAAFDISILKDGEKYQPEENKPIRVEITADGIGEILASDRELALWHIADDGTEEEILDFSVNGDTLSFDAESFSVYVIAETKLRTYRFYTFDEYGDYTEYAFFTDTGESTFTQTIKNGEKPVAPQNPTNPQDPEAVFAGWYEDITEPGQLDMVLADDPYDFDNIPPITDNEEVHLYAKFYSYAYVIFHDQKNTETGTFPTAFTRRGELSGNTASVRISDCSVSYHGADNSMVFYGWSYTPISIPGSEYDDDHHPVSRVIPDGEGMITITGKTDLYPIFRSVKWLSFYSGPTGSGATYYPETSYFDGNGPDTLNGYIPERDAGEHGAWIFDGWYAGASLDADGEAVADGAVKIAEADGSLVEGAFSDGISVESGRIRLTGNVMLYAIWHESNKAAYTIVIQRQKASDDAGLSAAEKSYEYAESFLLSGTIGSVVSVLDTDYTKLANKDNYNSLHPGAPVTDETNPYRLYVCNTTKTDTGVSITPDGAAILNVYYDWTEKPDMEGKSFTLTFADTLTDSSLKSPNLPVVYDGSDAQHPKIAYGEELSGRVPANPVCGVSAAYSFTGWYADANCKTRAFFTQEDYDAFTGGSKVLFKTMPGADLTVYAGWDVSWYVVSIDPNYGAMYTESGGSLIGTGSTWFWSSYGEKIQEYTTVTRDYVESDSGTWYYVGHTGDGHGGTVWPDRYTYYTQDPDKATEFTTFEYEPGIYRYAGWYEQKEDGTEEPYDFSRIVDHDITIKLHWTKMGSYYISYQAGEGSLNGDDEEAVPVVLDGESYSDNAVVVVDRTAAAPDGYEFTGWQIRGDDSGAVYRPGSSLTLRAEYAATVQGKKTVYLDAVYTRVPTAMIIYHANGGVMDTANVDYGSVPTGSPVPATSCDAVEGTATISNLTRNGSVILSDGSAWLSMENATFAGWCANPVYDPEDTGAPLLQVVSTYDYAVDDNEPVDLYAVWQVSVKYHLNKNGVTEKNFGGDWGSGYVLDGDTYTENVYLGSTVSCPEKTPGYTGSATLMFRDWRTTAYADGAAPDDSDIYDFTQPITGERDLYAYWAGPLSVRVHAVDASTETIVDKDSTWIGADPKYFSVSAEPAAVNAAASAVYVNVPEGYEFAFAAVHNKNEDIQTIRNDAVASLRYSAEDHSVIATFASGSSKALDPDEEVWFVYYEKKALEIGYLETQTGGVLNAASVSSTAPVTTGSTLLGSYDMAAGVAAPLSYQTTAGSYSHYAYAIGPATVGNTADLTLLTAESNSDSDGSRPKLLVRNTWRGFEYSEDNGSNWVSCGYEPKLYTVYFASLPTVVQIAEKTVGLAADMDTAFTYTVTVTQEGSSEPVFTKTNNLKNGQAEFVTLFHSAGAPQTITVVQTPNADFTTNVSEESGKGTVNTEEKSWTYTTTGANESPVVTYTNTRGSKRIEVHVAVADVTDGSLKIRDDLRSEDVTKYSFDLALGSSAVFTDTLSPGSLFTGDSGYAFGAVITGTSAPEAGSLVSVDHMDAVTIACEQSGEAGFYEIVLKDSDGNVLGDPGDKNIYYLYYQMPQIQYVEETAGGVLTPLKGSLDGVSESDELTYDGEVVTLNGTQVVQNQRFEIPVNGISLAQTTGSFRMPPIMDRGTSKLYLVYGKIGVGEADQTAAGDISVSEDKILYIRIVDNAMQWSFDGETWTALTGTPTVPTIYAIYRERGYDLTVTKTVPIDTGYREPFTVTLSSTAINRSSYSVEGTGSNTISAEPASGSTPGTITFTVTDGSSVRVKGLSAGSYTVTETGNENFNLTAQKRIGSGSAEEMSVVGNSSVSFDLNSETTVDLTNTAKYICRVGVRQFHTISSAVDYIEENAADFSGTIEMLVDYQMPSSDAPEIPSYLNITLTSADGVKNITRKGSFTGGYMFTNSGTLTLQNLVIDGNHTAASAAMIGNEGSLNIGSGAVLSNADCSAAGGAVNSWNGTVTVSDGASVQDNKAAEGGAIYASGGSVIISGGSLTGNEASAEGGAIYYTGSSGVTISGGTVSGSSAAKGGAVYMDMGTLNMTGGSLESNSATAEGGAIYSANAVVNISGGTIGGSGAGNTAESGGAIFAQDGSVTISGSAEISENSASGNGGAVSADAASVTISGGSITDNMAGGSGGAVSANTGAVTMTNGSMTGNTAAENGGGIYAGTGAVNISGNTTTLNDNTAAGGNGGAVYAESGTFSANKVSFSGNSASGKGGAVYTGSGQATLKDGSISSNAAVNGAAFFTNSGSVTFNGVNITGNTATAGGAVGIGSSSAKLIFSGNVKVTGNTMDGAESNVYLDQDTDAVINTSGLGANADIGIYVAGDLTAELFMDRGVPSAMFGTYTNDSNVGKFSNDRLTGLTVQKDTATKKLYWGKAFQVEVRYLASYANGFPPANQGTYKHKEDNYFAPAGVNAVSDIAAEFQSKAGSTAVFAHAFVQGASDFSEYITDVNWDSSDSSWKFVKHDGTKIAGSKLVIWFSEPAYISIENNSPYELKVNTLDILGKTVINNASEAGYGYLFAKNGSIQNMLYPVSAEDLTLAAGMNIKILIPGGRNAAYTLNGSFTGAAADISYTRTTEGPDTIPQSGAENFTLTGNLLNQNGTYEIIFGGSKAICKIVTTPIDGVAAGEIAGKTDEVNEDGKIEYTFSTLNQAKNFITAHMSGTKTATIEMLVDYLIPGTDVVNLPAGYDITFTTATSGSFQYPGTDAGRRAVISRDQGNNNSFITTETGALVDGQYNSKLTINNLIFDGKNFGGNSIEGGVIKTKGWNVEVDHADFRNCRARYGGGIFIESVWPKTGDQTPYGYLTVSNSNFTNCQSMEGKDKFGGGGIWTSMREMTITDCTFDTCEGAATIGNEKNAQGGAVFHFVAGINAGIETKSTVIRCTFDNCSANAAGSMECGAKRVFVKDCIFRNSTAKTKNGGALNIWVYDKADSPNDSYVEVDGCTFENCYCLNATGSSGNGGALRSTATHNTFTNCTFINTKGNAGGAINVFNGNAVNTVISGCSFTSCDATSQGGAVYCMSKGLTVNGTGNSISNCTSAKEGGGIYYGKNDNTAALTISSATFDNCNSNNDNGGGIYSTAQNVSLTDVTVKNCQMGGGVRLIPANKSASSVIVTDCSISSNAVTGDGGGLYYNRDNGTLSFNNSNVSGNTSGGMGGGIYSNCNNISLTGTKVQDNKASGNGGGVCHDKNSKDATKCYLLLDSSEITGNTSGGMGGGTYTLSNMTIRCDTTVSGNHLSGDTETDAAGVYLGDRTLTVGKEGLETDRSSRHGQPDGQRQSVQPAPLGRKQSQ